MTNNKKNGKNKLTAVKPEPQQQPRKPERFYDTKSRKWIDVDADKTLDEQIDQLATEHEAVEEAKKVIENAEDLAIQKQVDQTPSTPADEITVPTEYIMPNTSVDEAWNKKPITDKIEKLNYLFFLIDKLKKLRETKENLMKFVLSTDGAKDSITINDSDGNEFTTYQKHIVKEVFSLIKKRVDEMIVQTENSIVI